jgi:hypothetical protein
MHERRFKELLAQPDFSLEHMLRENEMTTQLCKFGDQRALDYLSARDQLTQLIKYATAVPEDSSHDVGNKFPYVAAELLSTNASLKKALLEGGQAQKNDSNADEQFDRDDDDEPVTKAKKGGYSQVKIKFASKASSVSVFYLDIIWYECRTRIKARSRAQR